MALGPKTNQGAMFTAGAGFKFKGGGASGPSGVRIEHRIGIQAPVETIWDILYDLERWHEWNPLYPQAEGKLRIGGQLTLTLALEGEKPQVIQPTVLDWVPNDQIHWRLKMMGGLVSTTRFLELEKLEEASTIFSNGELIGGLLGPTAARRMGRKIYRGFEAMSQALKARAEAQWRAAGGTPTSAA
jgi:hypothetical protein